jgi:hypothetical protein
MRLALPALIPAPALVALPLAIAATLLFGASGAALAQPRGGPQWSEPGWGDAGWGDAGWNRGPGAYSRAGRAHPDPAEGRVTVSRFVAEGAAAKALRTGAITVTGSPTGSGVDSHELAAYEAAVVDQLAQSGYRTDRPDAAAAQVAELHVTHDTVAPAEQKKPVSGTMAVGVSNRGMGYGLGLNVDLTKPRAALVATRLEARIRDKASGTVLWEGRADVATREDDDNWPQSRVAARLAAALFDGFPGSTGEALARP